jgi:hypothetical protein
MFMTETRMHLSIMLAMIAIRAETGMTTVEDAEDLRRLSMMLVGVRPADLEALPKEAR